ncbi:MAG: UDP-3-O-acyl-N-acetylglucosamine deacetylase [Armatimonadota bacterium]
MPQASNFNLDGLQRPARTLSAPVSLRGVGIHSGVESAVTVFPGAPGDGVIFVPIGGTPIAAAAANVVDTSRCTVLGANGQTVSTVEHLLSAFAGLGITDARIEIDGPEVPILDGSALPWVEAILSVGILEGETPAATSTTIRQPLLISGKNGSFIHVHPASCFSLTVAAVFDHPLIGTQVARFVPSEENDYAADVAPARTFGFIEEVEALRSAGLALGGSLDNAVVVYPDRYSAPLRFPAELAYHKLLDMMGDLFLAFGEPLSLRLAIVAVKPSHRLNVELASRLRDAAAEALPEVNFGT